MSDPVARMLEAASFAARAHRHQTRKDGQTPYAAHVFRVCLIVRHVFGIDDTAVLTAALLHDAIEDTPTDRDDLSERFGEPVAGWAAALTKDMRLPDDEREAEYVAHLESAPWQVAVCKLADVYDNMTDSRHMPPDKQRRTFARSRKYLDAIARGLTMESEGAFRIVDAKWRELSAGQPT